ncbi:HET-domain-containing protein [Hyaloscypha hepaticicola]|uniref:HET-domain-containing protein n=1 Tax=Hyaloscypha hepaticicola TaxID=2082293 RepID=A0A2J6QBC8_9HELO|nr:HET-domain-containing protein [Hyaloscypha hepaticicola]
MRSNGRLTEEDERELRRMKEEESDFALKPLKAETRYLRETGVSFLLRVDGASEHDVLADIDFSFENALRKSSETFSHSLHTQSERSWTQILEWINECTARHTACQNHTPVTRPQWPTRLIAVGDSNSANVRLCDTSALNCSALVYITLSHCWGQLVPTQLLIENYSTYLEAIDLSDLPKTFRDAVELARKLEVPYLWIDSLCIVQNSATDWASESSKMNGLYKNSYLNLAAAASMDANGGLFYPRSPLSTTPCIVKIGQGADAKYAGSSYTPENERSEKMVLFTRAWVSQECLLAPRILLFGKEELHWECNELRASETFPQRYKASELAESEIQAKFLRMVWRKMHENTSLSSQMRLEVWSEVVSEYSGKKLTKVSDKLVALAGPATDLGKSWATVDYLAGLWSYRLRRGLLWRCWEPSPPRQPYYSAPSWSWASVDGPVFLPVDDQYVEGLTEVLTADIQASDASHPYGIVCNGYVLLKGPMVKATVSKRSSGELWDIIFDTGEATDEDEGTKDEDLDSKDAEDIIPLRSKISASVSWDDRGMETTVQAANVYLLPLEVGLRADVGISLEGLLLLPTFLQNGQFRRLGYFEVQDDWYDWVGLGLGSGLPKMNGQTHDSWQISLEEEAVILDGCPQKRPLGDSTERGYYYVTQLDAQALVPEHDKNRSERIKEWMRRFRERSFQNLEENQSREDDRYCNGLVDKTLTESYGYCLKRGDYPRIESFLSYIADSEKVSILSDQLYEERHGGGYFTIQII